MKNRKYILYKIQFSGLFILVSIVLLVATGACTKDTPEINGSSDFKISSPAIGPDSLLPKKYTCDGVSATLPVEWENVPSGTVSFTLTMHHVASPEDVHWYWILYNIPAETVNLPENVNGTGSLGTNSVNDRNEYAPPCSQGPGIKAYTYTIYALSEELNITTTPENINLDFILNEIQNKIISKAGMTVYYARDVK
jgi:Raf kinase inhibitor-like YbhB/YbcL family protein